MLKSVENASPLCVLLCSTWHFCVSKPVLFVRYSNPSVLYLGYGNSVPYAVYSIN